MAQAQNMIKYIIKRMLLLLPTMFVVLMLTFLWSRMLAGDPTMYLFPPDVDPETRLEFYEAQGFNDPWYEQLINYFIDFFRGDFGVSYLGKSEGFAITEWVAIVWPRTMELMLIPMIVVPIIGVNMGITSATNRNKIKDQLIRGIGVIGVAFPVFWLGMLMQMGSGILLQDATFGEFWIPTSGFKNPRAGVPFTEGMFRTNSRILDCIIYNKPILLHDTIIHYILPVLCLTLVSLATTTRITRTCMLDVLDQDYVRTARAKGCKEETVIKKHALRNAMIPISGVIIGSVRGSLLGSMILEQTFNIYGMGMSFFLAIIYRDFYMINGIAIYIIIVMIMTNLFADVMYTIIDPRIVYT